MAMQLRPFGTPALHQRQPVAQAPSSVLPQPQKRAGQQLHAVAAPEKVLESFAAPSENGASAKGLNHYSKTVTQVKQQAGSQAMLYATGLSDDDFDKPQVLPFPMPLKLIHSACHQLGP